MRPPRRTVQNPASIFVNIRLTHSLIAKIDQLASQDRVVMGAPLPKMKRSALIRWLLEVGVQAVEAKMDPAAPRG